MFKILVPLAFILSMLGCSGCQKEVDSETANVEVSPITWEDCGYEHGDHPCDFTMSDQNGDPWNFYDNHGSIIIIDLSTAWCYYCQVAAADAQILQDEYKDSDVIYVSILVEDMTGNPPSQEEVTEWANTFGITAPVLGGNRDILKTSESDGWNLGGWPTFYFIDRDLVLKETLRGYSDAAMISILDSMLVEENSEQN